MNYLPPTDSISKIIKTELGPSTLVTITDYQNHLIEIEKYHNSCWSIEVRLDLTNQHLHRQEFTGDQETLTKENLQILSEKILSENQALHIDLNAFSFQLYENNQLIFDAGERPFRFHPHPTSCYRDLMSLKVTDFSKRSPSGDIGTTFETQMCTFKCPRPQGTVLGLPGTPGQMNRNGYRYKLYNTDHFIHTPNATLYQSWPILFFKNHNQTKWIGIFFDNPSETYVDIGDFEPDHLSFEALTNNIRIYLATGNSLAEVSKQISLLTGKPTALPLWAFGYQQCRWSYMSTNEIRTVAKKLRAKEIPCDSIYFDIDYMDQFKVFTNDPLNFRDLQDCIAELHANQFKAVAIVDPGVKIDQSYPTYKALKKSKSYLKNIDGSDFKIVCWPGKAILPDFFTSKARELWAQFQKDWLDTFNFDGVWNDMNEPANFDGKNEKTAQSISTTGPVKNKFNLYGYYMAMASRLGMLKKNPTQRPFVISRSGYPGVQKNAVIWHGDNHAWWEHLRLAMETCINYSLCGAYYTGPDVPGFSENPPEDLAIRFFQLGAFLPFYRGHSIYFAKDKEPYAFSPHTNKLIKEAILLRYSLIREWYTGFYLSTINNSPLMSPIFDGGTIVRDQFLLFDKLLVCPITERDQKHRTIYLPEGDWYELGDTKNILSGGRYHHLSITLDSLPIFVKAGSLIFRNTPSVNTYQTIKSEQIEIYPNHQGEAIGYRLNDDLESIENTSELICYQYADGAILPPQSLANLRLFP